MLETLAKELFDFALLSELYVATTNIQELIAMIENYIDEYNADYLELQGVDYYELQELLAELVESEVRQ